MLPTSYVELDQFPLTIQGKLDISRLPSSDETSTINCLIHPRTALETKMLEIWVDVLQNEEISICDNFFEIGGHSLLAVQLIEKINQKLNVKLKVADLFKYPTIETLCTGIDANALHYARIVPLVKTQNNSLPLFIIPGVAGNPYSYLPLGKRLGSYYSVYGLRDPGFDGAYDHYTSIEDLAAYYVEGILNIQTIGPFTLVGHSFGALIAYQIAGQLIEEGQEIKHIILLDTKAPAYLEITGDQRNDVEWLIGIKNVITEFTGLPIQVTPDKLYECPKNKRYQYYLQKLIEAHVVPPATNVKLIKTMIDVHRNASMAMKAYCPISYPISISLIKAENKECNLHFSLPADWGWETLTNKKVNITTVPGTHITMIVEPYAKQLAEMIHHSCTSNN